MRDRTLGIVALALLLCWPACRGGGGHGDGDMDVDVDGDGDTDTDVDSDADSDMEWEPGDPCNYWLDSDESPCLDSDVILYCGEDDYVHETSCSGRCSGGTCGYDSASGRDACFCGVELPPVGSTCDYFTFYPDRNRCSGNSLEWCDATSGQVETFDCSGACDGGICIWDAGAGYFNCACPDRPWEPGYPCDYASELDDGTCHGSELTYCGSDNQIYEVECNAYCQADPYLATGGTCGTLSGGTYNGCNCYYDVCDFEPKCDALNPVWLISCDPGTGNEAWLDCNAYCMSEMGEDKGICEEGECLCG